MDHFDRSRAFLNTSTMGNGVPTLPPPRNDPCSVVVCRSVFIAFVLQMCALLIYLMYSNGSSRVKRRSIYSVKACLKERSYHSSYLIWPHVNWPYYWYILTGSECAVNRRSSPWLQPTGQDSATYFVLTGRSHGELGRFTAHSLPLLSPDAVSSAEMRCDERYERSFSNTTRHAVFGCPEVAAERPSCAELSPGPNFAISVTFRP